MINLTILPPSFYNLPPPFEKVVVGGGCVCPNYDTYITWLTRSILNVLNEINRK